MTRRGPRHRAVPLRAAPVERADRWHADDFADDERATPTTMRPAITSVKLVVAGGFGVGKTTFVGSISEIAPLRTEAAMTSVGSRVDRLHADTEKTTTTVAMDFGRLTVDETLVMYLFGTPGQDRFGFMWNDICNGALGGIVLVDTRRIDQSFPALDFFEAKQIPHVIAANCFDGAARYPISEVRESLGVSDEIQVLECDARKRPTTKVVLLALLEQLASSARLTAGV